MARKWGYVQDVRYSGFARAKTGYVTWQKRRYADRLHTVSGPFAESKFLSLTCLRPRSSQVLALTGAPCRASTGRRRAGTVTGTGGVLLPSSLLPSLLLGFAFFALWLSPIRAAGQDKAEEAEFVEPIVTEETMPNEVGEWNLRFACVYESGPEGAGGDCPQTQVFFGIAPRWGAEVEASFPRTLGDDEEEPAAEISITLKYLLRAPGTRGPAIVLAMETAFAVDRGEESEEGRIELQPTLAWLQPLGRATLQGNVGLAITPGDDGSESQTSAVYNASLAFPLPAPGWHGFAEVAGIAGDEETELVLSPGLKYGFSSGHFLAVGIPVGLTSHSPDIGLIVQMQLSLGKSGETSGLQELARSSVRRRN